MLIEQAFHNLPEILVGSGYARQDYKQGFEASIVAAFSLAILQELNGRNAPNPISFLVAEKRYFELGDDTTTVAALNVGGVGVGDAVNADDALDTKKDKLRADLYVNLADLFSGSADYSDFGFRFSNWVEAKYWKDTSKNPPSTQNLGKIVADLFRLVALVPHEPAKSGGTLTGRYFLHVYRGDPLRLINPNREDGSKRKWVAKLLESGEQKIPSFDLAIEKAWPSFFDHLGVISDTATCSLKITNYKIVPPHKPKDDIYTLVLTRIDAATFSLNGRTLKLTADRGFEFSGPGKFDDLRSDVAKALKQKIKKPKQAKADGLTT